MVDDSVENRELLEVVLDDHGLEVSSAENGAEALELADGFDLVLMDVQMPVMDGYTAVRTMRERGLEKPVFALTAEAMEGTRQKCLEAGFSGYLSKPINFDELLETLAEELGAVREDEETTAAPAETATPESVSPIYCSLPMDNPRLREIAQTWLERLGDEIAAMRAALEANDLERLVGLAHKLKGSGGSVGFDVLTEPSARLEELAKQQARYEIPAQLDVLDRIRTRLRLEEGEPEARP